MRIGPDKKGPRRSGAEYWRSQWLESHSHNAGKGRCVDGLPGVAGRPARGMGSGVGDALADDVDHLHRHLGGVGQGHRRGGGLGQLHVAHLVVGDAGDAPSRLRQVTNARPSRPARVEAVEAVKAVFMAWLLGLAAVPSCCVGMDCREPLPRPPCACDEARQGVDERWPVPTNGAAEWSRSPGLQPRASPLAAACVRAHRATAPSRAPEMRLIRRRQTASSR